MLVFKKKLNIYNKDDNFNFKEKSYETFLPIPPKVIGEGEIHYKSQ